MPSTRADHRLPGSRRWPATGRLPALRRPDLDETQRAFYDTIVAREVPWAESGGARAVAREVAWAESGGARAIAADGTLLGPFNALLLSPVISAAMLEVFRADKAGTSLPARIHEIVIITVGAGCNAGYELYAHRAIGHAAGLPDAIISAIIAGEQPVFESEAEASAHDFTYQLTHAHRVDDETYARAARAFSEAGLMDMVLLAGLYLTVCAIVNAFEVPVPARPAGPAPSPS
jgi:4-carboxymuconolactone decarboxylase